MKILLQGFLCYDNFGDTLFAKLFYDECRRLGFEEVDFLQFKYGIGDKVRKEIGYTTKKSYLQCLKSDVYVMLPGGPLWGNSSGKHGCYTRERYFRYIFTPRLFQLMRKPVYVLGVGGGPVLSKWLRRQMVKFLNHSKVIYFRDIGTKKVYEEYGVKKPMTVTADAALVVTSDMLPAFEKRNEIESIAKGRKKILLHIPSRQGITELRDIVFPGFLRFLKEHPEYIVVLSNDTSREYYDYENQTISTIKEKLTESGIDYYEHKYSDVMQMCALINEMDCIVTEKLHVGIVGIALSKPVIAFPCHREKVNYFFNYIEHPERCIHLRELTPDIAYSQLTAYHNKPIIIKEEYRNKAKVNLQELEKILHNSKSSNTK